MRSARVRRSEGFTPPRLVEEDHLRFRIIVLASSRSLFCRRRGSRVLVFQVREPRELEGPERIVPDLLFLVPHALGKEPRSPEAFPHLPRGHEHEVFENGHELELAADLERAAEALAEGLVEGEAVDPLPFEKISPASGL